MMGIHSTIGMQIWCKNSTSSSVNSPLSLPACAPAQVNVDFLDGEDGAMSTSNSTADFGIFEILFEAVDMVTL